MSTNQPTNTQPTNTPPDWRELRRQERAERRAERRENGWAFGAILIVVGVLLFLQNINAFTLHNWWALFLLLPAAGSLGAAWRMFNTQGKMSPAAISSLIMGLVFVGIAAVFLFDLNLDWTRWAPALLILFGIGLLLPALFRKG